MSEYKILSEIPKFLENTLPSIKDIYRKKIGVKFRMNININKVKIFVTIPPKNVKEVRKAVCEVGAGVIGDYTYCTSSTKSIGTFIPNDNANPYIGEKNKLEFVEEEKLEFVCEID